MANSRTPARATGSSGPGAPELMAANAAGWIDEWIARNPGRRPIVVLANVEIDADAAIPPERLTAPIRETMLASGRVRVLDGRDLARNLRDARPEDRRFTNLKDVAPIAGEVGAHFVMLGRMALRRSYSREQARVVPHHSLDFEIVELSSGEPVWTGARRITRREEE